MRTLFKTVSSSPVINLNLCMNRRGLATKHIPRDIKPIEPDKSEFDYEAYVKRLEE